MNISPVNASKMVKKQEQNRLFTAVRGYKLLGDKYAKINIFLQNLGTEIAVLQEIVNGEVEKAIHMFQESRMYMTHVEIENAILAYRQKTEIKVDFQNILGTKIPKFEIKDSCNKNEDEKVFLTVHPSFERSIKILRNIAPKIIELGEKIQTHKILTDETKKLSRRINTLEYNVIPKLRANIDAITFKLGENDRANLVRLMKIRDLIIED